MNIDSLQSKFWPCLKKWGISLLLLPYMLLTLNMIYWALDVHILFAVNYDYPFPINFIHLFIDNFLLIVHEAGHTFFGIFGIRFLSILGGSLFQILLPSLIVWYCWINRYRGGMQFTLFLIGYSWLDVAAYAADARARRLPLIGGLSDSYHDWYNLLLQLNALQYDRYIGIFFVLIGICFYLSALLWPLLYKQYKSVNLDLEI